MEQDHFLHQIIGKKVKAIYLIDFENEPKNDIYSPWQILIDFEDIDKHLDVEDAHDGDHIRIGLDSTSLDQKLTVLTEPNLWKPYQSSFDNLASQLIGKTVTQLFYAKEKKEYELNGQKLTGDQSLYSGLKVLFDDDTLTIFSNGVGLSTEINTSVEPYHKETYDWLSVLYLFVASLIIFIE